MKKIFILLLATAYCFTAAAQKQVPVFTSGEEGHKSYRIPAIVRLPNGELLAFCEGRVNNAADFGDINIVMKKSRDNGKTWGPLQPVVDYENLQAGNPAPVVDMQDPAYPSGRIFLFYNTGNEHEPKVRRGQGLREVWYKTSEDGGATWSAPVNITMQTHRPKQPSANPAYNFSEDWRTYANTPGHALQFQSGPYKGRIYVAANHTAGDPLPNYRDGRAHGYYSDDHGKTFRLSDNVEIPGGNEAIAAELPGGRLMMNIRNQKGGEKARIVALSSNGGQSWDTAYYDFNLPDPVCQGTLLNISGNRLAFCNAADTLRRDHLTLRISNDEGKTWRQNYLIDKSPDGKKDYTAYSDIVQVAGNRIGVLYEKNGYRQIIFTTVKIKK